MQVKILYFTGCPNLATIADRVRMVLAELGQADVSVQAEDVQQASALSPAWAGSPTLLLDGRDPFAAADRPRAATDGGLNLVPSPSRDACRIYVTANGLGGAPSVEQLRTALVSARELDGMEGENSCDNNR
jgi:hypothetical protein